MKGNTMGPNPISWVKRKKGLGMTLVEVLVASAIIAISVAAVLKMLQVSQKSSRHSLMRQMAITAAKAKLEEILSYEYNDPNPDGAGPVWNHTTPYTYIASLRVDHTFAAAFNFGTYRNAASGTWVDTNSDGSIASTELTAVSENLLGYRRFGTINQASTNSDNPFPLSSALQPIYNYVGFEIKDFPQTVGTLPFSPGAAVNGGVRISAGGNHVFWVRKSVADNYDEPCLAFADDVDDFDGSTATFSNFFRGMTLSLTVAVHAKMGPKAADDPFPAQAPDGLMGDLGIISHQTEAYDLLPATDPSKASKASMIQAATVAAPTLSASEQYYAGIYYKEVVITASWIDPPGSVAAKDVHYITLVGGKRVPI